MISVAPTFFLFFFLFLHVVQVVHAQCAVEVYSRGAQTRCTCEGVPYGEASMAPRLIRVPWLLVSELRLGSSFFKIFLIYFKTELHLRPLVFSSTMWSMARPFARPFRYVLGTVSSTYCTMNSIRTHAELSIFKVKVEQTLALFFGFSLPLLCSAPTSARPGGVNDPDGRVGLDVAVVVALAPLPHAPRSIRARGA